MVRLSPAHIRSPLSRVGDPKGTFWLDPEGSPPRPQRNKEGRASVCFVPGGFSGLQVRARSRQASCSAVLCELEALVFYDGD